MVVEHKYFVGYQYVDKNFGIKNSALLMMFEDLACIHGDIAGEDIRTSDSAWLLTGYIVDVKKRPEYRDTVTVRTWSRSLHGFIACREFDILDENGNVCVTAISEWVHVKHDGSGFSKVSPELEAAYESEPGRTNYPELERNRLPYITQDKESDRECPFTVTRSLIDSNNHLNNVFYLELAEAVLDRDFVPDGFFISFRKEIKLNETVRCCLRETDDAYRVSVKSADGTVLHAQIILNK